MANMIPRYRGWVARSMMSLALFSAFSGRLNLADIEYEHAAAVGGDDKFMIARMHRQVKHRDRRELGAQRDPGRAGVEGHVDSQLRTHVEYVGVVRILGDHVHRFGRKVG